MADLSLNEFAGRIEEVMPFVMRELARRQTDELYKGKITLQQFLLMDALNRLGASKMTDLARIMHVTTPNMTGLVERLVRDGYCLRAYERRDRRVIRIKLTAKGSNLLSRICGQRRRMLIDIFSQISGRERRSYLDILMHIKEVISR